MTNLSAHAGIYYAAIFWALLMISLFFSGRRLYIRWPLPVLHPLVTTVAAILLLLVMTGYPRSAFRAETQPFAWLLGPAVVALAVPVWNRRALIARNWRPLSLAVGISLLASAIVVLALDPLSVPLARALGVRSVTLPVGLAIERPLGTPIDMIVATTMMSALIGLVAGPTILRWTGLRRNSAEAGIALGCTSHALGTARALEEGETAGAFASTAMGLSAAAYGVVMPFVLRLF